MNVEEDSPIDRRVAALQGTSSARTLKPNSEVRSGWALRAGSAVFEITLEVGGISITKVYRPLFIASSIASTRISAPCGTWAS